MARYDNDNPGPPGIYQIYNSLNPDNKWYRKRDESRWYRDAANPHGAVGQTDLAPGVSIDKPYLTAMRVADLQGNPVEPREARRIGDPEWLTTPPCQIQMDLFQ